MDACSKHQVNAAVFIVLYHGCIIQRWVSLHSVMSAVHIRPWKTLHHSDDVKSCHTKNTLMTNKDTKFNPFTLCTLSRPLSSTLS